MHKPHGGRQGGIALLESLIALLIVSFGILGILGLQASAIGFTTDARDRVEAAALTEELIARIWLDPRNIASYTYGGSGPLPSSLAAWGTAVQSKLPNAAAYPPIITVTTVDASANVYDLDIKLRWAPPGAGGAVHNYQVVTTISPP